MDCLGERWKISICGLQWAHLFHPTRACMPYTSFRTERETMRTHMDSDGLRFALTHLQSVHFGLVDAEVFHFRGPQSLDWLPVAADQ